VIDAAEGIKEQTRRHGYLLSLLGVRQLVVVVAVLTDARFSDPEWIFERKLDGIRCIAIRDGGPVKLLSRNDLSLNGRYFQLEWIHFHNSQVLQRPYL
jgi:ATP-dependent DNA ligase